MSEEVDEGIEKEEKEDVPLQEDEETGQNNPAELEQMEQEQEVRSPLLEQKHRTPIMNCGVCNVISTHACILPCVE